MTLEMCAADRISADIIWQLLTNGPCELIEVFDAALKQPYTLVSTE
jgi:hypothetical protein